VIGMTDRLTVEMLRRSDTALGRVLDCLFDGVYVVDHDRRIIYWNRGAESITGYTRDDVMGKCCSENLLNHVDEDGNLLCQGHCPLVVTLQTGEEIRAKVYPLHKDGHRFPIETHIAPIRDEEDEIIAAIEVFRDISQQEAHRILQEKFDRLVQRYVSRDTYEEIVAQASSETEGRAKVRDLSILYLDIVGFTALSERNRPEEVVATLNDVFGICDVITREHNGDIDKFIGDAIMAVFVDANDAVRAAVQVVEHALPRFNAQREERGEEPIHVRVGVNSGMVVQGDIGTSDRKDLTVIGDVVNTAQRIESVCEPDTVCISQAAYARLAAPLASRFESRGSVHVKGRQEAIPLYGVVLDQEASPRQ